MCCYSIPEVVLSKGNRKVPPAADGKFLLTPNNTEPPEDMHHPCRSPVSPRAKLARCLLLMMLTLTTGRKPLATPSICILTRIRPISTIIIILIIAPILMTVIIASIVLKCLFGSPDTSTNLGCILGISLCIFPKWYNNLEIVDE